MVRERMCGGLGVIVDSSPLVDILVGAEDDFPAVVHATPDGGLADGLEDRAARHPACVDVHQPHVPHRMVRAVRDLSRFRPVGMRHHRRRRVSRSTQHLLSPRFERVHDGIKSDQALVDVSAGAGGRGAVRGALDAGGFADLVADTAEDGADEGGGFAGGLTGGASEAKDFVGVGMGGGREGDGGAGWLRARQVRAPTLPNHRTDHLRTRYDPPRHPLRTAKNLRTLPRR